jgi:hypothetical protein
VSTIRSSGTVVPQFAKSHSNIGVDHHPGSVTLWGVSLSNRSVCLQSQPSGSFYCVWLTFWCCMKALIEAAISNNEAYQSIRRSTIGILFLGTPHQGASVANKAAMVASIAEALFNPNTKLLRSLKRNCDSLFQRDGQFSQICGEIRIFTFYEMRKTANRIVVSQQRRRNGP